MGEWTKVPPTEPGWYWWRRSKRATPTPILVGARKAFGPETGPWRMTLRGRSQKVYGEWHTVPIGEVGARTPLCESVCQWCHGANVVWFVDSALWNEYVDDGVHFLCPSCFVKAFEAGGGRCTGWKLIPENLVRGKQLEPR